MNCHNIPPRNPYFTGREEILKKLRVVLTSGEGAAGAPHQVIFGPSGIGKTQIAIEYAHRHQDDYQAMLWVQASTRVSLISGFTAVASLLNLPEKDSHDQNLVVAAVKQWLDENNRWLLIFDEAAADGARQDAGAGCPDLAGKVDFATIEEIFEFLPDHPGGHVLLTCRAQEFPAPGTSRQNARNASKPVAATGMPMPVNAVPGKTTGMPMKAAAAEPVKISAMLPDDAVRFLFVRTTGKNDGSHPEDAPGDGAQGNLRGYGERSDAQIPPLPSLEKDGGEKAVRAPGEAAAAGGFMEGYSAGSMAEEHAAREIVAEEAAVREIARELGCLPLALELAGAYIAAKNLRFQDYLIGYRRQHKELLAKSGSVALNIPGDYPTSIAAVLAMSFQEVEKASEAAADLLRFFTFLVPASIPGWLPVKGASQLGSAISAALADAAAAAYQPGIAAHDMPRGADGGGAVTASFADKSLPAPASAPGINQRVAVSIPAMSLPGIASMLPAAAPVTANSLSAAAGSLQATATVPGRSLPEALPVAANSPPSVTRPLDRLLQPLARYSLIHSVGSTGSGTYCIHRLIQAVLQGSMHMNKVSYRLWAERTVLALCQAFPEIAFPTWPLCDCLLPHIRAVANVTGYLQFDFPQAARLFNLAGYYLYKRARYVEAEPFYQWALAVWERILMLDHRLDHPDATAGTGPDNLRVSSGAQALYAQARSALDRHVHQAEPLATQAMQARKKISAPTLAGVQKTFTSPDHLASPDHLTYTANLNHLAMLYDVQGKYAEAAQLLRRALEIRERTLGPDHPDVAKNLDNLAMIYYTQGRYAEAAQFLRRALEIRERTLGPDHPDIAQSLTSLAAVSFGQGKYQEAEQLFRRVLTIREKALGPDHPDVVVTLNNLMTLYHAQGRYKEAKPLSRRISAIRKRAFGPDHPGVAQNLSNLADLHRSQGRYAEAEELHRRALAMREKTLGLKHPEVAQSLYNLAVLSSNQGKQSEAEQLFRQALAIREKALGPDHQDLGPCLNNLAALHYSQGKYAEAEKYHRRALAIREKNLGPDHQDLAACLENYADLLRKTGGNEAEAAEIEVRAVAIRAKYGKGHLHQV